MWITPCNPFPELCRREGTTRGIVYHQQQNSVGVQPTTGLFCLLSSFIPSYATLTRGYQYLTPSEFFC